MWRSVFREQLRTTLGSTLLYLFAAFMALQGFQFSSNTVAGRTTAFAIEGLWHNSPYVIARYFIFMSIFGFLFITVLVGPAVVRDFEHRCHEFFFTSGIGRASYLSGRFLGAFVPSLLIYAALIGGYLLGTTTLPADRLGAGSLVHWVEPIGLALLPNLLLVGVVFFCVATLTRSAMWTYVLSVGALVGYAVLSQWTPGESMLATVLDPFGLAAFDHATALWTQSERNLQAMPLTGPFLVNRALWLTVTVLVFSVTLARFRFTSLREKRTGSDRVIGPEPGSAAIRPLTRLHYPETRFSPWSRVRSLVRMGAADALVTLRHPGFLIVAAIGLAQLASNLTGDLGANGSLVQPRTSIFLSVAPRHIAFYVLAITVFFAPSIVWRERDDRSAQFFDSLPLPDSVFLGGKLLAVLAIQTAYMGVAVLVCILIQVMVYGYTEIEPSLYLSGFFGIELVTLWLFGIAVVCVQTISPSKFWGIAFGAVVVLSDTLLTNFGVQENLYRYGTNPGYIYSEMNGFGHFLEPLLWHQAYWGFGSGLLIFGAHILWRRGVGRRVVVRRRGFAHGAFGLLLTAAFLGTGSWIFYNTHVVNDYRRSGESTELRASYESRYGPLRDAPRPSLRHVALVVDIFPEERSVVIDGAYTLRNDTEEVLDRTLITVFPFRRPEWRRLESGAPGSIEVDEDPVSGVRSVRFSDPLKPGDEAVIEFEVAFRNRGFAGTDINNEIVGNGTYVDGLRAGWYLPIIGYEYHLEIVDEDVRRAYGMGPRRALPDPASAEARRTPSQGGDRTTFDITVVTDEDQTPLGPGEMVETRSGGGRTAARFHSDTPVSFGSLAFFSGRYELLRTDHEGVHVDVYFHPGHDANIERMVRGVRRSLDYGRENYGPYPYDVLRIVEVPDLGTIGGTARALPGVVAWTETGGFLSDLSDPSALDVVYNTTTHETAHQWWGHQLAPGMAAGGGVLVETVSQWVRLMTLEREYGAGVAEDFRRAEMVRYLRSRPAIGREEPLRLSNDAGVLYRKGTVVMSALGDALGEARVNQALRGLFERFADSGSFPTTDDLISEFRAVANPDEQRIITDLFETITLYDNAVVDIDPVVLENDSVRIGFTVRVEKLHASGDGQERGVPARDRIEVAALDVRGNVIHSERILFTGGLQRVEFILDRMPDAVEIDPRGLLIDRDQGDNRRDLPIFPPSTRPPGRMYPRSGSHSRH